MRPAPALTLILGLVTSLGVACGSDADPLLTRCESTCNNVSPPSPCANDTSKGKCITDCRALASSAQTTHGKTCGECIADSFKYSAKPGCENDPTCCWGTGHANPSDDTCRSKCFEPDGGLGF